MSSAGARAAGGPAVFHEHQRLNRMGASARSAASSSRRRSCRWGECGRGQWTAVSCLRIGAGWASCVVSCQPGATGPPPSGASGAPCHGGLAPYAVSCAATWREGCLATKPEFPVHTAMKECLSWAGAMCHKRFLRKNPGSSERSHRKIEGVDWLEGPAEMGHPCPAAKHHTTLQGSHVASSRPSCPGACNLPRTPVSPTG